MELNQEEAEMIKWWEYINQDRDRLDQVSLTVVKASVYDFMARNPVETWSSIWDTLCREHIDMKVGKYLVGHQKDFYYQFDSLFDEERFNSISNILADENIMMREVKEFIVEKCSSEINMTNFFGSDSSQKFADYIYNKYEVNK